MNIVLASDHAGFTLKQKLVDMLKSRNFTVVDEGAHTFDPDDDYTDFIAPAAKKVSEDPQNTKAIILGGSGQGEAMLANRFKNVRAAVYYGGDANIITLSREHNDANVLSLGARFIPPEEAEQAVLRWLETPFSEKERYQRRIEKAEHITT